MKIICFCFSGYLSDEESPDPGENFAFRSLTFFHNNVEHLLIHILYLHSTGHPEYEHQKFLRDETSQLILFAEKIARKPRNLVETNTSKWKRDNYGSKGKTKTNKIVLVITS
jgi:hypothetical protein